MDESRVFGFDRLSELSLSGGAEMRPILLRVLTDLYVQKLAHTREEEDRYTELALRLLDSVDIETRIAVAGLLVRHLAPPQRVIARLMADIPEVAAQLSAGADPAIDLGNIDIGGNASDFVAGRDAAANSSTPGLSATTLLDTDAELARELDDTFFAASPHERRLILINLDVVATPAAGQIPALADPSTIGRLETAALARKREDFNRLLAGTLHIAHDQAERIGNDPSGEPIVVAAKALGIAREVLYRMLLFINPTVGQSVDRVHGLVDLYDEISMPAARHMVAVWQALNHPFDRSSAARYRPAMAGNVPPRHLPDRTVQRPPLINHNRNRRAS